MSKGMEALRRSKASAGEAPNLPPHNLPEFLPASLMNVEFSGAWPAARLFRKAPTTADTRSLASGSLLDFRLALPLVDPYGALYGGEPQRSMPRAAAYNLSTQGVDELFVVQLQDLFHAEALTQDVLEHYGCGSHANGVALTRPGEPLYLAVVAPLEVDDNRPPALGAASWYCDVGFFLYVLLVLVARIPGVLDQERGTIPFTIQRPWLRFQISIFLWEP